MIISVFQINQILCSDITIQQGMKRKWRMSGYGCISYKILLINQTLWGTHQLNIKIINVFQHFLFMNELVKRVSFFRWFWIIYRKIIGFTHKTNSGRVYQNVSGFFRDPFVVFRDTKDQKVQRTVCFYIFEWVTRFFIFVDHIYLDGGLQLPSNYGRNNRTVHCENNEKERLLNSDYFFFRFFQVPPYR